MLFLLCDWSPRFRFLEYKYFVCTINVPAFFPFESIRKRRVRGIGYDFFSLYVGTSYEISRPFLLEEKEESILLRGRTKTENKLPERFFFPPITFVAVWNEKGREFPVSDRMSRWHPVVRTRASKVPPRSFREEEEEKRRRKRTTTMVRVRRKCPEVEVWPRVCHRVPFQTIPYTLLSSFLTPSTRVPQRSSSCLRRHGFHSPPT